MYSPVFIIILVVFVLNNAFSNTIDDVSLEETERIVGGLEARPGQFPFVAALFYNGEFICTCTIVSPTTLLTAAHCVVFGVQERDLFYAIANVSRSATSTRINFGSITVHPDYDEELLFNDIAVLTTSEPIQISNDVIRPVCIASPNTREKQYLFATAMGWGNTIASRNVSFYPDRLRYTPQKIIFDPACSSINRNVNYERQMCASGLITGICDGDSGGPLVHMPSVPVVPIPFVPIPSFFRSNPVAIGLASYVNNRTACGLLLPTVWTRLSAHYDFIMQTARDSSICTV